MFNIVIAEDQKERLLVVRRWIGGIAIGIMAAIVAVALGIVLAEIFMFMNKG